MATAPGSIRMTVDVGGLAELNARLAALELRSLAWLVREGERRHSRNTERWLGPACVVAWLVLVAAAWVVTR